jgi:hypothetical protein
MDRDARKVNQSAVNNTTKSRITMAATASASLQASIILPVLRRTESTRIVVKAKN